MCCDAVYYDGDLLCRQCGADRSDSVQYHSRADVAFRRARLWMVVLSAIFGGAAMVVFIRAGGGRIPAVIMLAAVAGSLFATLAVSLGRHPNWYGFLLATIIPGLVGLGAVGLLMTAADEAGVVVRRPIILIAIFVVVVGFFSKAFYDAFKMARLRRFHLAQRAATLPTATARLQ